EDLERGRERPSERGRANEIEVVGRRVVLGVVTVRRPGETADGEVETWRAVLPLVVSVGRERNHGVLGACLLQDVRDGVVDLGVAASAALAGERPAVAERREHEAVLDPAYP